MRRLFSTVIFLMLLAGVLPAFANDAPSLDAIRAQQTELREQVLAGRGEHANRSNADRARLVRHQDTVLALIEGKVATEQLEPSERMQLFNELEAIKALVQDGGQDRLVCQHVKKTGSQMRVRECKTVAQREREREDAEKGLRKGSPCSGIGCPQR